MSQEKKYIIVRFKHKCCLKNLFAYNIIQIKMNPMDRFDLDSVGRRIHYVESRFPRVWPRLQRHHLRTVRNGQKRESGHFSTASQNCILLKFNANMECLCMCLNIEPTLFICVHSLF